MSGGMPQYVQRLMHAQAGVHTGGCFLLGLLAAFEAGGLALALPPLGFPLPGF